MYDRMHLHEWIAEQYKHYHGYPQDDPIVSRSITFLTQGDQSQRLGLRVQRSPNSDPQTNFPIADSQRLYFLFLLVPPRLPLVY
jgi:hypothetical protein